MNTKLISPLVLVLLCVFAVGRDADWFDRRMRELDSAIAKNDAQDKIPLLGSFLSIGSHGGMDAEQRVIFTKAQAALLAIPGHAKYHEEQIEKKRAEVLANSKKSMEELNDIQDAGGTYEHLGSYLSYCERTAFPTLALMPSPEAVAVLGRYLNDPEGRDGKTLLGTPLIDDDSEFSPNAEQAATAIRKLGIEDPPYPIMRPGGWGGAPPEEIDAWRDWWNEVKAGRRTYRFKGDSTEYGPDGPASAAKLQSIERNRQRDAQRIGRESQGTAAHGGAEAGRGAVAGHAGWIAFIAGALLIAAGAGWLIRRRYRVRYGR